MDSFENAHAKTSDRGQSEQATSEPELSLAAMRRHLTELRRQARLHHRDALVECLSLAIALSAPRRSH